MLGDEQRHPAVQMTQQRRRSPVAAEDRRVELPAPAAVDGPDGGARHVLKDVGQGRLIGHGMEARDGRLAGGIDAQRAERACLPGRLLFGRDVLHGRVDHHDALEVGAEQPGRAQRDETAHAVPHDDRQIRAARRPRDRQDLVRPAVQAVVTPPGAVAMTGQIQCHDPPVIREQRTDVIPPARVRGAPVHQDYRAGALRPPRAVGNRRAVDRDRAGGDRRSQGCAEPRGRLGQFGGDPAHFGGAADSHA